MKNALAVFTMVALVLALAPAAADAQSGHFLTGGNHGPHCTDIGTQVECSGRVTGLGGTVFQITIEADGLAEVICINPGGNQAPGQDTDVTVEGSTDPLPTSRSGNYRFTVTTDEPGPLSPTPTCPNEQWEPNIAGISFATATLSLYEDGVLSDQVTVPVN
jgi:hypothetical protein